MNAPAYLEVVMAVPEVYRSALLPAQDLVIFFLKVKGPQAGPCGRISLGL